MRADLLFGAAGRLQFPFLFGGTFIEGVVIHSVEFLFRYFPSFSEGLSLRAKFAGVRRAVVNFPSFSEGLSLRGTNNHQMPSPSAPFPFLFGGTFIEGPTGGEATHPVRDFPSFSEGLSLRVSRQKLRRFLIAKFPFLFGGTFIEGKMAPRRWSVRDRISLPFRRDFH